MRALILGNMANDGYAVAKEARKLGYDVDLAINVSDFGMSFPEWEDADLKDTIDPYYVDGHKLKQSWTPPSWIRYFDFLNNKPRKKFRLEKTRARLNLFKMMREYDIIEAHVPYPIYAQFSGVPMVVYDAGWIRYFPYENHLRDKLARRAYGHAKSVILTNPDTYEIFDSQSYIRQERLRFSPFAIDPEKYKSVDGQELRQRHLRPDEDILLFAPSRQIWAEKGNDKMIKGYAKFLKQYPSARFIMVGWSTDELKSKALAQSLGISHKIDWISPVPKNQLIQYYGASDIVLDQFTLGSWGTSTPEAMCCGKPVLMYYKQEHIMRAFNELPPIPNCFTEDDICNSLLYLARNTDARLNLGKQSRDWIIKTHHSKIVAERHMEILEACQK